MNIKFLASLSSVCIQGLKRQFFFYFWAATLLSFRTRLQRLKYNAWVPRNVNKHTATRTLTSATHLFGPNMWCKQSILIRMRVMLSESKCDSIQLADYANATASIPVQTCGFFFIFIALTISVCCEGFSSSCLWGRVVKYLLDPSSTWTTQLHLWPQSNADTPAYNDMDSELWNKFKFG